MTMFNALKRIWPGAREGTRAPASSRSFRPRRHVYAALTDGRFTLMDLRASRYYGLDDMGTAIWALLEAGRTPEQIAAALEPEYDATVEVLRSDVSAFVEKLEGRKLIEAA